MLELKLFKYLTKLKYQVLMLDYNDLTTKYILYLIHKHKVISPKEITQIIHIKPQALANILTKMEKNQLIVRSINKENKRKVDISLTEKGEKVGKEYCDKEIDKLKRFIDFIGEEDAKKIVEILERVGEYIEEI